MNAVTEDIKDEIEDDSSLGLVFGTNLFIGSEPETPDECITLYDSPGWPSKLDLDGDEIRRPSLFIRSRALSYTDAQANIELIYNFLQGKMNFTRNGARYISVLSAYEPRFLEYDNNRRAVWVVSFDIMRT